MGAPHDHAYHWIWAAMLAGMIFIASGFSHVASPTGIVDFDKLAHFSVYGLLATLVTRALPRRHLWLALVVVSLYGLSDEWHQSFTPGREADKFDWLADTAGGLLAVVGYGYWQWYRELLERRLCGRKTRVENPAEAVEIGL